jgi:hypothetical protein
MYNSDGCNPSHQVCRHARRDVLGLSEGRFSNENLSSALQEIICAMENDFLDGIDEQFQRLMKLSGNGKRNGRTSSKSPEDNLIAAIVEQLYSLSQTEKEEVLAFVQSIHQKAK